MFDSLRLCKEGSIRRLPADLWVCCVDWRTAPTVLWYMAERTGTYSVTPTYSIQQYMCMCLNTWKRGERGGSSGAESKGAFRLTTAAAVQTCSVRRALAGGLRGTQTLIKVEQASKNSQTDTWAKGVKDLEVGVWNQVKGRFTQRILSLI